MSTHEIEPGLLKVFRLMVGVEFVLSAFAVCAETGDSQQDPAVMSVYALALSGGLLVWLWWRWGRRRLGRAYLTLALAAAWIGPVIGLALAVAVRLDQGARGAAAMSEPGELLLWLLVPLLLTASQYRMRAMLFSVLGTAGLELALAAWLQAAGGPALDPIAEEILVRVMLFSIVGYVVVRLSAAQREQRRALARKNADLAHYATTLEQLAISRERNRLARELHDTLAHTLSAMSVQLQALEVLLDGDLEAARATLRTLQDMTRQGVGEARRALGALRASPLEDLGLLEALRRLAESTAERAGLRLALDLPDSLDDLRPDLEQHLYRIAEEALANVVRHANAATLTVRLRQRGDGVTLLIADDGLGFDPATATADGHYGLRGIQERARLVGGALTIDSQPGQGARLALSVKDAT